MDDLGHHIIKMAMNYIEIILCASKLHGESTPFISRLLGAKIRKCELSSLVRPRLATCRITDPHILPYLQFSNSVLSDNRGTYVSWISTHIDIAPATNHNKRH